MVDAACDEEGCGEAHGYLLSVRHHFQSSRFSCLQAFGAWLREPEVYANFHKAFNDNDRIQLTPWTLEGRAYNREVVAYLPVNAPHWFRKAIGLWHGHQPCSTTCRCLQEAFWRLPVNAPHFSRRLEASWHGLPLL